MSAKGFCKLIPKHDLIQRFTERFDQNILPPAEVGAKQKSFENPEKNTHTKKSIQRKNDILSQNDTLRNGLHPFTNKKKKTYHPSTMSEGRRPPQRNF
jgi:hypothetical protein